MEDKAPCGGGLRTAPLGNLPAPLQTASLPSWRGSLPHRVLSLASRHARRGLCALLFGWVLAGPVAAQSHSGTTYTGAPFNFCLPGYDSYDYQECWDFNWAVANSSWTGLATSTGSLASSMASQFQAVGVATTAIAVATATLGSSLTAETAARVAGDLALGISTTAIAVATTTLQTNITTEESSRVAGDLALGLSTTSIAVATTTLQSNITAEASARSTTDSGLQAALDTKLSSGAVPAVFVDLSTVTAALALKYDYGRIEPGHVDLSTVTTALATKFTIGRIDPVYIDLSTVTTALAAKMDDGEAAGGDLTGTYPSPSVGDDTHNHSNSTLSSLASSKLTGGIPPGLVDLSTVTAAIATKLDAAAIPTAYVDLSTVTTALAGKQDADADLTDLADGSLTASKVAAGYASSGLSGEVPIGLVNLSTVTTALAGKLGTGDNAVTASALVVDPAGCSSPNFTQDINASGVSSCAQPSDVTGNAATVTNGVYTTGSYNDPSWLTRIATSKVDLSTITTALAGKQASGSYMVIGQKVEPVQVDLSTVTTALAAKQAADSDLDDLADGSLTASKVASGYLSSGLSGGIPAGLVDLSTVTTALGAKQAADADLDDLADGSLTASKVATGYPGSYVSGAVATASALAADGANCSNGSFPGGVDASGAVQECQSRVDTASALNANGANCSAGNYPLGVDASGAVESCTALSAANVASAGTAGTAGALTSDPSDAPSGKLCRGINASGVCEQAHVDTAATNGSTNTLTSDAIYDALALKQDLDADLTDLADGSLTASKVASGYDASGLIGKVPPVSVDLSTITTALGTKQASDADLDDLADGTLTGSKVGSGVPAANIANGTMGTVNTGGTAAALAANPSPCAAGQFVTDMAADGTLSCDTPTGSGDTLAAADETITGKWEYRNKFTMGAGSSFISTGVVHMTTCTYIPHTTGINQSAFTLAYATVTINTSGSGRVRVWATVTARQASGGSGGFAFLQDGGYLSGYTSVMAAPGGTIYSPGSTVRVSVKTEEMVAAPSAGPHTFAISARDYGGGAVVFVNDANDKSMLCAEEVK